MSPPPDQPDRDRIRRVLDENLLVEASAGTGKTRELVERMVALVLADFEVEKIAAVTFTRRAAGELRQRFQLGLEEARQREADPGRRARLDAALFRIDAGFIGTIHAFCAELLRERPVEAGLAPGFREVDDDDPELLDLRDRVWRERLEAVETGQDAQAESLLAAGVEPADLGDAYETVCRHPDVDFDADTPGNAEEFAAVERAVRDAAREVGAFLSDALAALRHAEKVKEIRDTLESVQRLFLRPEFDSAAEAADALRRFASEIRDPKSEPRRATLGSEWKERARGIRDEIARPALSRWHRYLYPRAIGFVTSAEREFRRRRSAQGLAGFTDLLVLARNMLRDNPAVRRDLSGRFPRILVDEFQDTDPVQAEVLLYLGAEDPDEKNWTKIQLRPGSLFVVGDPKQAIYRFRRADLAVYGRFRDLLRRRGELARLSASFRSVPEVCDFVNRAFGSVFLEDGDESQAAAATLAPVRADAPGPAVLGLTVETSGSEKASAAAERHAAPTADFIAAAIAGGRKPADFLVLAPKRNRLTLYQKALESRGIRSEILTGTEKGRPSEMPAVLLGFVAALEAAARPSDPVSVVAFLRSALCGASDEALWRFRQVGGSFDAFAPPPADAGEPMASGLALLRECAVRAGELPPAAALSWIAGRCGLFAAAAVDGNAESAAATGVRAVTLSRRLSREGRPFREVAREIAALVREARIFATSLDPDADAVRLMTVHAAKGLEAPVVVLADPGDAESAMEPVLHVERGARARGSLVVWRGNPGRGGTVLAEPPGWEAMSAEEKRAEAAEGNRKIYVAATRARDTLVVGLDRHTAGGKTAFRGPWASLAPFVKSELPPREPPALSSGGRPGTGIRAAFAEAISAIEARRAALARPSFRLETATRREPEAPPPDSGGRPGRGAAFGTVLHRLLEARMRRGDADLPVLAELFARGEDLSPEDVADALRLAGAVLSSPLWQRASAASSRFVEVPFVVPLPGGEGGLLRGAIDLVFHEPDGWVVVDYKTDRVTPSRLPGLIERYRAQVETYRREWERFSEEKTRAALYFVDSDEPVWL